MSQATQKVLSQLVERLQKAYGDRLTSVVLYGSAATGEQQAKFSDTNILCLLTEITPRELTASEELFRWWREQGNPAPLLLTEQEAEASADCFAIEFLDIQRNHRVLYGQDLISGITVHARFYRAQVEHELRAKLLRLRQKAGGVASDPDLLRQLLLDSVSTFCVLFRHALALRGAEAPALKRDIIAAARREFGIDSEAFERLLDAREERIKPRDLDPHALLGTYLLAISAVIGAVDASEDRRET